MDEPIPTIVVEPAKTNWLLFSLIGVAILIIGIVAGFFVGKYIYAPKPTPFPIVSVSPTPVSIADPTATWKTYTNESVGLSFKYPPALSLKISDKGLYFVDVTGLFQTNISWNKSTSPLEEEIKGRDLCPKEVTNGIVVGPIANSLRCDFIKSHYASVDIWIMNGNNLYKATIGAINPNTPIPVESITLLNQILSTFKFTGTTPTVIPATNKNVTNLYYKLPDGWKTVQDETGSFEVGYDPNATTTSLTYSPGAISIFIKGNIGGAAMSVHLKNYDSGSRHQFIYKFTSDNQPPQKQDLGSDYNEKEYLYNNKSCLFLRGIYTSQFPNIWGMCDAGSGKAFLITSYVPDYETMLQTIRLLK